MTDSENTTNWGFMRRPSKLFVEDLFDWDIQRIRLS